MSLYLKDKKDELQNITKEQKKTKKGNGRKPPSIPPGSFLQWEYFALWQ